MRLLVPDVAALEDALASRDGFQIHPSPEEWNSTLRDAALFRQRDGSDPLVQLLHDEMQQGRLRADLAIYSFGDRA